MWVLSSVIQWMQGNPLYWLLAIGTLFNIFWLKKFKEQLQISNIAIILLSIFHTIFGVLSVRLFAEIEVLTGLSEGGKLSLFGGIYFMPIYYYFLTKILKCKAAQIFDIFAICIIFTLMCARVGCIISGCCQGRLIPGMDIHYPTREAEILFYVVLIAVLSKKVLKSGTKGEIYPVYMIAYGIFRFFDEFFRARSNSTIIHPPHFWALLCLIIGLSIYIEIKVTEDKRKNNQGRRRR